MAERDEEWTEWFRHDGSGCPVVGYFVQARNEQCQCRQTWEGVAFDHPDWRGGYYESARCPHCGADGVNSRVDSYRIRRPRALQQLREMIRHVPTPKHEETDA